MESKPKPKNMQIKELFMQVYHCAQLSYTIQHKTVLIIFTPNLHTIITAQMLSIEGRGKWPHGNMFVVIC